MFGRAYEDRGKLLDEWLDVLLRAWRGERFEWQGRTVHVTPAPYTRPHPPIFVGGQSRRGALRAARFGLGYQPASNDRAMEALYVEECKKRGATPQLRPPGTGEMIWVSRDPDRTWAEIGEHLLYEARVYSGWQPATQQSSTVHSRADHGGRAAPRGALSGAHARAVSRAREGAGPVRGLRAVPALRRDAAGAGVAERAALRGRGAGEAIERRSGTSARWCRSRRGGAAVRRCPRRRPPSACRFRWRRAPARCPPPSPDRPRSAAPRRRDPASGRSHRRRARAARSRAPRPKCRGDPRGRSAARRRARHRHRARPGS